MIPAYLTSSTYTTVARRQGRAEAERWLTAALYGHGSARVDPRAIDRLARWAGASFPTPRAIIAGTDLRAGRILDAERGKR